MEIYLPLILTSCNLRAHSEGDTAEWLLCRLHLIRRLQIQVPDEPSFPDLSEEQTGRTGTDLITNSFHPSDWQHPAEQPALALSCTGQAASLASKQSDNLLALGLNRSFPGEPSLPGLELPEEQTGRASVDVSKDDGHSFPAQRQHFTSNNYRVVRPLRGRWLYVVCAYVSGYHYNVCMGEQEPAWTQVPGRRANSDRTSFAPGSWCEGSGRKQHTSSQGCATSVETSGYAVLRRVGTIHHSLCGPAMCEDFYWVVVLAPFEGQLQAYIAYTRTLVRICGRL